MTASDIGWLLAFAGMILISAGLLGWEMPNIRRHRTREMHRWVVRGMRAWAAREAAQQRRERMLCLQREVCLWLEQREAGNA